MRFSVLIPLEFHRGLAERCIRGWCGSQSVPGDTYEVLVAAPADHDCEELDRIASVLRPHDSLLKLQHKHDMALVAEAARRARGKLLVFTEAHCLPEHDFLEQAGAVLAENPGWAGFSGRSVPITHNLLSEVEAEMYAEDISRNLREHDWLKVLDQCFVISREAYFASGGIEPEYGHFAEWLLAARLHARGLRVGHDARAAIRHYYVGDLADLEEFTDDFTRGQMLFAEAAANDRCGNLFDDVPEWAERYEADPAAVRIIARMMRSDLSCVLRGGPGLFGRLKQWPWTTWAKWLGRRWLPENLRAAAFGFRLRRARKAVENALARENKAAAKRLFLRLVRLWVRSARQDFLREWRARGGREFDDPSAAYAEWRASRMETVPAAGFHALESFGRSPFRWSEPAAIARIPSPEGELAVTVRWAFGEHADARFYLDGLRVDPSRVLHGKGFSEIKAHGKGGAMVIGWVCPRFEAPGDGRQLGAPVVSISSRQGRRTDELSDVQPRETFYFLHIQKCGGTSLRLVLDNAQAARETLGSFDASWFYYHDQLQGYPGVGDAYKFAAGHFGWELPALVRDREWRIVTVLRDPVRRMLSEYSYMKQHAKISPKMSFAEWLHCDLMMVDLALPYFVPGLLAREERGARQISPVARGRLSEAMSNLGRCAAVGLQERMEDTVDLLCWKQDSLPPEQVPRINETEALERTLAADVAPVLRELLPWEFEVYEKASGLFAEQFGEMQRALEAEAGCQITSGERRRYLRQRFFERKTAQLCGALAADFSWGPGDVFVGCNLHAREEHAGKQLRWTGPSERTVFYTAVAVRHKLELRLAMHPATPRDNAESVRVFVNGAEAATELSEIGGGYVLHARCLAPGPRETFGAFSEVAIISRTVREQGGFRSLGVALCGIEIRAT